jgi:hypothetical protein
MVTKQELKMAQLFESNLPIETLAEVKARYRAQGTAIRIRYRGPRRRGADGLLSLAGKQDCLKADALRFSVYAE